MCGNPPPAQGNVTLLGKQVFAELMKLRRGRALTQYDWYLYEEKRHGPAQRGDDMKAHAESKRHTTKEAAAGVTSLRAKESQGLAAMLEAQTGTGQSPP